MKSRERLLAAYQHQEADYVPVSPDISAMIPIRLTGKPFDAMFLDGKPHYGYASASVAQAYVDAIKFFGMDGWYIYGGIPEIVPDGRPCWETRYEPYPGGGQMRYRIAQTPYGALTARTFYPNDNPEWEVEKPIKNLREDWPKLRAMMGEDGNWQWDTRHGLPDRERIGDQGVYSVAISIPQDWWFFQRHGGYEASLFDFSDEASFMEEEVFPFYTQYTLARLKSLLPLKPDEIMLGGSASSLSASSPRNFRKFDLPFIQRATQLCHEYGVFAHLHVCGRSRKVVEMIAEETDVDVMEPLEEPPGGDVDIADIKRRYGHKLCLKGNINTFDFMLNATPEQIAEKAKRLIDICAPGGGFVLSTGDQCGRDTPDANLFKLVEVARTYGVY